MTVAQDWPLQQAVFATITTAAQTVAPGIVVYDHVPTDPDDEHVRIDAFHVEDDSLKNGERARHSFMVHHFLRPAGQNTARGMKRGKQVIAAIHAALMASDPLAGVLEHETTDSAPDEDGASAHVWSRYSVIL